jgi:hypothetical protein
MMRRQLDDLITARVQKSIRVHDERCNALLQHRCECGVDVLLGVDVEGNEFASQAPSGSLMV